jgi:hypothetical protein
MIVGDILLKWCAKGKKNEAAEHKKPVRERRTSKRGKRIEKRWDRERQAYKIVGAASCCQIFSTFSYTTNSS